jgi:DNA-binding transcriptional regulator PaaX
MAATLAILELVKFIDKKLENKNAILSYSQMRSDISRSGYYKKLKKFEKLGLVKKTLNGNKFELTQNAKLLRGKTIKLPRTDGLSTLIIFDIGENKHNARDTLRRYLLKNGYTQLQKSCFLSGYQVSNDLKDLISELQIRKNVVIFSAKMDLI